MRRQGEARKPSALDAPEARNVDARRRTVHRNPAEAKACPTMPASALPGRRPSTPRRATGRRINLARRSSDRSTRLLSDAMSETTRRKHYGLLLLFAA